MGFMKSKRHKLLTAVRCVGRAAHSTVYHDGIEHAGYLAFLGLLALFPFLVFVVAVAGVMGQGQAGAEFITAALNAMPVHLVAALQPRVVEIVSGPPQGLLTVAILGTIWTASSAVEGIRTVLNRAYHVTTPPAYLWRRTLSILQLLAFTFILIAGMVLVVFTPLIFHSFEELFSANLTADYESHWQSLVFLTTHCVLFFTIAGIYYILPNIKQNMLAVIPGAVVVMMAWVGAAHLLTLYLLNFNQVNLVYGSLGGIIAALVFFYICNIIFIFGAELNYQILIAAGHRVHEKENAEPPAT